jgi:hypothetical protein
LGKLVKFGNSGITGIALRNNYLRIGVSVIAPVSGLKMGTGK